MKRELPLPAIIGIIATIVVLVIGLFVWKAQSPSGPVLDAKTVSARKNAKDGGP